MGQLVTLASFAACLIALPARAQVRTVSLAVGLGGGWAGTTSGGCVASNENGPPGFVHLTTPIGAGLRIGAEYNRWRKTRFDEPSRIDCYMGIVELPVLYARGLSATLGVGYGKTRYRQWDVSPEPVTTERSGPAYEIGVAYAAASGHGLLVAPFSQIIVTRHGTAPVSGDLSPVAQSTSVLQDGMMLKTR